MDRPRKWSSATFRQRRGSGSAFPSVWIFAVGPPQTATRQPGRRPTSDPDCGSVEARFRRALQAYPQLIPNGASVVLAFSGGSDSTALLHLLRAVREVLDLDLTAAHFDHGLRPESAVAAARAADVSRTAGVPCEVGTASGLSGGQAEYRKARYAFLRDVAERSGAARVALAHQRDDHHETLLLNLMRGTGVRGLAGIPVRRGPFVRPLLGIGRAALRDYLIVTDRDWLDDPANLDRKYLRTRVRCDLAPTLRRYAGPSWDSLLSGLTKDAWRAEAGLEARAVRLFSAARLGGARGGAQIARSTLLDYDRADRARILRKIARDMGFRLGRRGTQVGVAFMSEGSSGHGVDIAGDLRISREYERIRVSCVTEETVDRELEISVAHSGSKRVRLGGRDYRVQWGPLDGTERWTTALPRRALRFPLRVRGPQPGDRIRTRVGSRKLKKLLNELRVPASERSAVPVLVGADQRVLWVAGQPAASHGRPGPGEEMFTIGIAEG